MISASLSLAVQTLRRGPPTRALQTLLLAAAIDDRFAEVHFRLGRALMRSGQMEAARSEFLRARDLDAQRDRADTEINRIIREAVAAALALTDWDRLRVRKLIARRHRNPLLAGRRPPPYDRASTGLRDAHLADAVAAYGSALERAPQDLYLRRNLGWLLRDLDQHADAVAEFERLVQQTPNLTVWRTELATLLLAQDRAEESVAVLRAALRQDPKDFQAHRLLGQALAAMGEDEAAVRSLRRALHLHPYLRDARAQLAQSLYHLERYEEAIPQLEVLVDNPPGDNDPELAEKLQRAREHAGRQP